MLLFSLRTGNRSEGTLQTGEGGKKKVLKPVHRLNLSERAKSETERHKGQMEAGVFE